jgi:hypothetical protein
MAIKLYRSQEFLSLVQTKARMLNKKPISVIAALFLGMEFIAFLFCFSRTNQRKYATMAQET